MILRERLLGRRLGIRIPSGRQESFLKTLTSIYHHRIEYPGFKFEERPGRDRVKLPG